MYGDRYDMWLVHPEQALEGYCHDDDGCRVYVCGTHDDEEKKAEPIMIDKQQLVDYFWTYGNLITTKKGVELEMHGDSLVEVSVMLRCAADIEINGLEPMVQLSACFEDFEEMQRVLDIEKPADFKKVTVADMIRLHATGIAKMEEIDY